MCGEGRKIQAGGGFTARFPASLGRTRARPNLLAAGEDIAAKAVDGRLNTAIGIRAAIDLQSLQR